MPRKILLTGRVPSFEETARIMGLSQKRARQIAKRMDAIIDRRLLEAERITRRTPAARAPMKVSAKRAVGTRTRTSRS
jgi:alkylated DNA nucleotide flippase Atl1